MQETPQEYTQRMLGMLNGQSPLKIQAATPNKLGRLIARASGAKLRKKPAPGKWSVAEIITHLADCEIVTAWRIRQILGAPGTPLQPFDQDSWAAAMHYEKRDARKSLAQFRAARESNLELLKSLMPEQWKQHGMHAERGPETIERIVGMMAGHDLNHLGQVERLVAAKKRKKSGESTVES